MMSASFSNTVAQSELHWKGSPATRTWFSRTKLKSERKMTVRMLSIQASLKFMDSISGSNAFTEADSISDVCRLNRPGFCGGS